MDENPHEPAPAEGPVTPPPEAAPAAVPESGLNKPEKFPPVWSEFLSWLTFANPGMLTRSNVSCLDYAIRHLPSDAPILEIGSFCGLSTNIITHLKQKHQRSNPLITCDKWIFEGVEDGPVLGNSSISHVEYRDFVKQSFMRNVSFFGRQDLPYTFEATSDEFFQAWTAAEQREDIFGRPRRLGGPFSLCFIDGNHTEEFARRDFENCDRDLEPGGFVLFDDSADGSGWGVCIVVKEVLASGRYDLLQKDPNYFFRKRS